MTTKPFDLNIEFTKEELVELRDSFSLWEDSLDGKISIHEIAYTFNEVQGTEKNITKLMLDRINKLPEIIENDRVDFDQFIVLLKKSLNVRKEVADLQFLFRLMTDRSDFISKHNLEKVAKDLGYDLSRTLN